MNDKNKDKTFALWKNTRREKKSHPHFNGSIIVNGVEYWVSMWWHKDRETEKHPIFTGEIKPKKDQPLENQQTEFVEDDLPF